MHNFLIMHEFDCFIFCAHILTLFISTLYIILQCSYAAILWYVFFCDIQHACVSTTATYVILRARHLVLTYETKENIPLFNAYPI
jgi:hypothetical protein